MICQFLSRILLFDRFPPLDHHQKLYKVTSNHILEFQELLKGQTVETRMAMKLFCRTDVALPFSKVIVHKNKMKNLQNYIYFDPGSE